MNIKKNLLIIGPHHAGDTVICIPTIQWIIQSNLFTHITIVSNDLMVPVISGLFVGAKVISCPPGYKPFYAPILYGINLSFRLVMNSFDEVLDLRSDFISTLIIFSTWARIRRGGNYWATRLISNHPLKICHPIQYTHEYFSELSANTIAKKALGVRDILSPVAVLNG